MIDRYEFLEKFYFYHRKLSDCYSYYVENSRINDWYEKYRKEFSRIRSFLGNISHSMLNEFYLSASKLFDNRHKDSLCIQVLVNTIMTNKIISDDIHKKLIIVAKKIKDIIDESENELDILHNWRDRYYAHYDKKILSTGLEDLGRINTPKILLLVKTTFDIMNDMLEALGEIKITPVCYFSDEVTYLLSLYIYANTQYGSESMNEFFSKFQFPDKK